MDSHLRQQGHNKDYVASPLYHMHKNRILRFRQNLETTAEPEYAIYRMFRDEGGTNYFVGILPFARADGPEQEDSVIISLLFDQPDGLTDDELAVLEAILQVFALSARSAATYATAQSVVHTYLERVPASGCWTIISMPSRAACYNVGARF